MKDKAAFSRGRVVVLVSESLCVHTLTQKVRLSHPMGTAMQTVKLAAIPAVFPSSRFISRPVTKALTLGLISRHNHSQKPPFRLLARAFSAPALQTIDTAENKGYF